MMVDQHLPARRNGAALTGTPAAQLLSPEERPAPLASLLASAVRLSDEKIKRVRHEAWQGEAWELLDLLGEVRFPAVAMAKALSRATLYAGRIPADDLSDPEPLDAGPAWEAVQALGPRSARAQHIRRMGEQLFVVGESYLVGTPPAGTTGQIPLSGLRWQVASADEVSKIGAPGAAQSDATLLDPDGQPIEDVKLSVRVWQPHPRRYWEATSPVRSSLPVLRELVGLTKHVSAQIDSRLAGAGILALTQGATVLTGGEEDETISLIDALIEAMVTPIQDRDAASAIVPLLLTVTGKANEAVHFEKFWTELDKEARPLREEAIKRWALGADIPAELLLGMSTANHWTSWLIREETVTTHLEPTLSLICDALTTQYLWPLLDEAKVPDAREFVVWYDASALTRRPNRADQAVELHKLGVLGNMALLRESGFDQADAPPILTPRQRALEIAVKMVSQAPTLLGPNGVGSMGELVRQLAEVFDAMPPEEGSAPVDVTVQPDTDGEEGLPESGEEGTPDTLPEEPVDTDGEPALPASVGNGRRR